MHGAAVHAAVRPAAVECAPAARAVSSAGTAGAELLQAAAVIDSTGAAVLAVAVAGVHIAIAAQNED